MNLVLGDGVSYCTPQGRVIFLDLPADRYFSLTHDADRSFQRLASGEKLTSMDKEELERLMLAGLLKYSSTALLPKPCNPPVPRHSAFENRRAVATTSVGRALWKILRANAGIRFRPLGATLETLRARKARAEFENDPSAEQLEEVAAALASCSLITSVLDRCLPRSIAAAHMMIDRRICPQLIIGVRLQPFSAHCWVQHRNIVINDGLDRVRNYTPIYVV